MKAQLSTGGGLPCMSMRFTLSMVEDRPPSLQSRSSPIAQRCGATNGLCRLLSGALDSWGRGRYSKTLIRFSDKTAWTHLKQY